MQKDIKTVLLAAAGVVLAGYLMNKLYDMEPFTSASDGFDM